MSGTPKLAPLESRRRARILVVDADAEMRKMLSEVLGEEQYELIFRQSASDLEEMFVEKPPFDAALVEIHKKPDLFLESLPSIRERCPNTEIVFISEPAEMHFWTEAIQRGAYDYLPRSLGREELRWVVLNAAGRNQWSH